MKPYGPPGFLARPFTKVAIAADIMSKRSLRRSTARANASSNWVAGGPWYQCNVGKRGWITGVGGCPNVGGICIGCTMPGFPDKFMPFVNQPPGSILSTTAVMTYGKTIRALRNFTQASLNKEPEWRRPTIQSNEVQIPKFQEANNLVHVEL
jgi:NiFe/NiFeSe hydrogenase small subunit C-terminal